MSEYSLNMIEVVARGLDDLKDRAVFVGGAVAGIYVDDPASEDARPTEDVDCVFQLATTGDYYALEEELRKRHFQNDTDSNVICRWKYQDITVDIMPDDDVILGFSNRWYKKGFSKKVKYNLPNGDYVYILPVSYYLATKLEAIASRGGDDLRCSHDFEDLIFVLNGCVAIEESLQHIEDEELQEYLQAKFKELIENPNIQECINCALPMNEEEGRCEYILSLLKFV